ncbi:MAG: hypothetical protein HC897_08875 [Thermoanaerobaculia bacterium]|nr:hypothetical protein [Thermoanaerobaculia bacterium]
MHRPFRLQPRSHSLATLVILHLFIASCDTEQSPTQSIQDTPAEAQENREQKKARIQTPQLEEVRRELFGTEYNSEQKDLFWTEKWRGRQVDFRCEVMEISKTTISCDLRHPADRGSYFEAESDGSSLIATFREPLSSENYLAVSKGQRCTVRGMLAERPAHPPLSGAPPGRRPPIVITLSQAELPTCDITR